MKTAVIYARYSCEKQTEQSIEGQLDVCQKYAEQNGYQIIDTYIDRATTGTNDNRVAFQRMLTDSNSKSFEAVIVYKLDRFARNKYESAINRKHLRDNGVKLISAMENIPDSPEGIILEALLEGMNEYFSAELAQKVSRGLYISRTEGKFVGGKKPFGYNIVNQRYEINEAEADIIRAAFRLVIEGVHVLDISKMFPEVQANFYHLVRNIKYKGCLFHQGEIIEGVIPPIVSPEIWEIAQEHLKLQETTSYHPKYKYRLANKVFCAKTGIKMNGCYGRGEYGSKYRYYATKKPTYAIGCDELEELVVSGVLELLTPSHIKSISRAVEHRLKKSIDATDDATIKRELSRVRARKSNIVSAIEQTGFVPELKNRLTELEFEENRLIAKRNALTADYMTAKEIEKFFLSIIQNSQQIEDRILKWLVLRVEVDDDNIIVYIKSSHNSSISDDKSSTASTNGDPYNEAVELFVMIYPKKILIKIKRKNRPRK